MTASAHVSNTATATGYSPESSKMLVTMRVNGQLFGIPVQNVRDVLKEQKVANIPLAPSQIAGSLNLRGRIVTVVNMRSRLKLEAKSDGKPHMFVVVEHKNEFYSLMVDGVGEVLTIPTAQIEKSPANIAQSWREVASGISRLEGELLVIIDIHMLLTH